MRAQKSKHMQLASPLIQFNLFLPRTNWVHMSHNRLNNPHLPSKTNWSNRLTQPIFYWIAIHLRRRSMPRLSKTSPRTARCSPTENNLSIKPAVKYLSATTFSLVKFHPERSISHWKSSRTRKRAITSKWWINLKKESALDEAPESARKALTKPVVLQRSYEMGAARLTRRWKSKWTSSTVPISY